MITYAMCKAPLRVSAPTVIPVCDHWNRGKTEVLSAQDRQTGIQGQTNIRPLPRLIINGVAPADERSLTRDTNQCVCDITTRDHCVLTPR